MHARSCGACGDNHHDVRVVFRLSSSSRLHLPLPTAPIVEFRVSSKEFVRLPASGRGRVLSPSLRSRRRTVAYSTSCTAIWLLNTHRSASDMPHHMIPERSIGPDLDSLDNAKCHKIDRGNSLMRTSGPTRTLTTSSTPAILTPPPLNRTRRLCPLTAGDRSVSCHDCTHGTHAYEWSVRLYYCTKRHKSTRASGWKTLIGR